MKWWIRSIWLHHKPVIVLCPIDHNCMPWVLVVESSTWSFWISMLHIHMYYTTKIIQEYFSLLWYEIRTCTHQFCHLIVSYKTVFHYEIIIFVSLIPEKNKMAMKWHALKSRSHMQFGNPFIRQYASSKLRRSHYAETLNFIRFHFGIC